MDVGEDTTRGDGDTAQKAVELFIVADGQLDVAWDDTALLVVTCGVTGELKDFSAQVLHDSGQVHWGTGSDTASIATGLEVAVHTANWELQTSAAAAAAALASLLSTSTLSFARHSVVVCLRVTIKGVSFDADSKRVTNSKLSRMLKQVWLVICASAIKSVLYCNVIPNFTVLCFVI